MTLSIPTRLNPLLGFRAANFTHRKPATRLTVPAGTLIPFPSTEAAHARHILMVVFSSPDGRTWQALGGGDTLADALAQDSCPTGATWHPVSWNDLYGD